VVLESSTNHDEEHANGNVECRGNDASGEVVGYYCNLICFSGSHVSHDVAKDAIHSQVVSQLAQGGCMARTMQMWRYIDYRHLHLRPCFFKVFERYDNACVKICFFD
jgi:hypothetical protein